jgi:hypothetical protein
MDVPNRSAGLVVSPSGVEYHPGATASGAPELPGQYTVTLPQGATVLFVEPVLQT